MPVIGRRTYAGWMMKYTEDGKNLYMIPYVKRDDECFCRFNLETGKVYSFDGGKSEIIDIGLFYDSRKVVSLSRAGDLVVWNHLHSQNNENISHTDVSNKAISLSRR